MDAQHKEFQRHKEEIIEETVAVFESNLKMFDRDIPENDDRESARLILSAMEEAIARLKEEVEAGRYDDF
ncbi:MAG: hypothetical protein GXO33_03790 [Epsilonproteobacteria bacterium]|nr:hypothetical protein [Campylobacterota bacterium]